MKKWALLFLMMGCGTEKESDGMEDAQLLAEDIWNEIEGYDSWAQQEGWEGVVASESTHGASVSIWVNELALQSLIDEETIPDGGIIVIEGCQDEAGSDLKAITVMKKIDGYNPDAGAWFWAVYELDGTVSVSGSSDFCISCPSAGDDYVMFPSVDEQ